MTGRITRLASLATLPALACLVGCKSVPQDQHDEAIAENAELRDRLAETQDMLQQSESDKQRLEDENNRIASELAAAQSEQASQPQQMSNGPGAGGQFGSAATNDVVVAVAGDVLFDTAQVAIKPAGRRELDRIARVIMTQYPGHTVRVEGYTDSDPIRKSRWKNNERLSFERALAVEQYLISRGLDRDLVYSAAMGPANPKSSKAESRRVEIVILAN